MSVFHEDNLKSKEGLEIEVRETLMLITKVEREVKALKVEELAKQKEFVD